MIENKSRYNRERWQERTEALRRSWDLPLHVSVTGRHHDSVPRTAFRRQNDVFWWEQGT